MQNEISEEDEARLKEKDEEIFRLQQMLEQLREENALEKYVRIKSLRNTTVEFDLFVESFHVNSCCECISVKN